MFRSLECPSSAENNGWIASREEPCPLLGWLICYVGWCLLLHWLLDDLLQVEGWSLKWNCEWFRDRWCPRDPWWALSRIQECPDRRSHSYTHSGSDSGSLRNDDETAVPHDGINVERGDGSHTVDAGAWPCCSCCKPVGHWFQGWEGERRTVWDPRWQSQIFQFLRKISDRYTL